MRISARFVIVEESLRALIERTMTSKALGVTHPQLSADPKTVSKVLSPGAVPRVNVGTLARLCLSIGLEPGDVRDEGYEALAAEMVRKQSSYTAALKRSMGPKITLHSDGSCQPCVTSC